MYFVRTATASVSVSDSNLYLYRNEDGMEMAGKEYIPSLLQNEA